MILRALVGFVAMSASATMSWASSPDAIGIGLPGSEYLRSIQIGTRVPAAVRPELSTGTRGSLRLRYSGPTDEPELMPAAAVGRPAPGPRCRATRGSGCRAVAAAPAALGWKT